MQEKRDLNAKKAYFIMPFACEFVFLQFRKSNLMKINTQKSKPMIINKRIFSLATLALSLMLARAQNPFLPLWEHIPDGEPHIFEDPDKPGKYRLYVYGSHDELVNAYCGLDQVVWSAPTDDLTRWRLDGVIFESKTDAKGKQLRADGGGDLLYAPDVCEVRDPKTGRKTYYLYPNNQHRNSMVAKADRPDGPFRPCNWDSGNPQQTVGPIGFDPAVLVDDDGRVYAYWGFRHSYAAELDPATMATVKPGTEIVDGMVTSLHEPGPFRFFEASSIRKVEDKYVFIYSRWSENGEFGLRDTPGTLAYAYSDRPLGPWTYGGTIIDMRGYATDAQGRRIPATVPSGNTHGSLCQVGGQWYIFYHRHSGQDEFARQAMVAPVSVKVEKGAGGKVSISQGEVTSEGFQAGGLDPLKRYSAGITCYYTGPTETTQDYPRWTFSGPYIQPAYAEYDGRSNPYDLHINHNAVLNNTSGSVVGYKYFNMSRLRGEKHVSLLLQLVPRGVDGEIEVLADSPWESQGGLLLGSVQLTASMPQRPTDLHIPVPEATGLQGRHALFLRFKSTKQDASLCDLHFLQFCQAD